MSNNGTLVRNLIRGGSSSQVALLSITTAPSGSFAVGSKYYNSSTKKIVTAVTEDTWVGATTSSPQFGIVYTFSGDTYVWDGNSLEKSDLNLLEKVANKSDSYTVSSSTTYASTKALVDGLGTKEPTLATASNTVAGKIRIATDAEVATGTAENLAVNPKQLKDKIDKYSTLPTATIDYVGIIAQYVGTTTVNYTNGYFYKGIATNMPSVATADITEATGITEATVNKTTFEGKLPTSGVYDFIYKEGSATGSVGSSTGVTSATVVKATFEALLATAGAYDFEFTDYLVTASIGASAGITSASVVKATFKSQLSTTGDYVFTYTASTASASIVGSTGISGATVDVAVFETLLATTGNYVFTFDGTDWKYDSNVVTLADYGIVATGTPNLNDVITISYAEDKWEYDSGTVLLSTYGITYEGTPADSDTITISYVEELWEYDGLEVTLADYGITAVGTPADGDIITVTLIVDNWYYLTNIVTLSDYGIVATGTPDYDDTITITYAAAYIAYSWSNINVQPVKLFLVPTTITPVSGTATVVLDETKVIYDVTPVEATTLVFDVSGLTIPSGNYIAFNLTLNMSAGVQTITFPASVQWGNVTPTLTSAVKYMFSFFSPDGGTTWIGNQSASWIVGA